MRRSLMLLMLVVCCPVAIGQSAYTPPIASASTDGEDAIARYTAPSDMVIDVFAAEQLLANPVAFCFDYQDRLFVAETFRHHQRVTVFADGFRDALAGIGSAVLMDRGNLYYTCIPELWKLRDDDGDGVAEEREVLSSGHGVHFNFLGHDLHGLKKGPDGRIYFSIGDRGIHVKTFDGNVVSDPDTGVVMRCFADGSGLEIVHPGLRNPQDLAFDDYGNLFTGDNNSDGGDQARLV